MVYAKVENNYTLKTILSEKDFIKFNGPKKLVESGDNIGLTNSFMFNHWYTFHNEIEAKIIVALKKVTYYELIMSKMNNNNNLEQWHGEMIKSLSKTKKWLEKMEIKYPEYFISFLLFISIFIFKVGVFGTSGIII